MLVGGSLVKNLVRIPDFTSCAESFEIIVVGEKSSNSEAFSLARATTLSGKFANSATWMPKL